jgi:hypothetical protein
MLRRLHAWVAVAFVASIVVQVFLAGAAIANLGGSGDFETHRQFGYIAVGIVALALVVTALVARLPRREVGYAVLLFVLYFVQTVLPNLTSVSSVFGALHPVNALFMFGLSVWYARRAWAAAAAPALAG